MAKYLEVRDQLKTGDIVLFSGKGGISEWIKWFTGADWSHVGMILRLSDWNMVLLWESTMLSDVKDVETNRGTRGVQLVGLRERLRSYDGEVAVRHLNKPITEEQQTALGRFRSEVSGRPYEESKVELLKSAADIFLRENKEDLSSLFCSELVAESYQKMGLLVSEETNGKPSNEYTPEDFSTQADQRLKLLNGYQLGHEISVVPD